MSLVYPGFINTGMFLNVDIGIKYLCPPLEPEDVSNAIVKNLSQRVSADIKLPSYGKVVGAITRLLPIEFADTLKNVTNANSELSSFTHSVSAIKNETATKKTE